MRLFPPCFFPAIIGGSAVGMMVFALLRREWLSAGVYACILLMATAAARSLSEPANTFRDHARRALRSAGLAAGLGTLMAAARFGISQNRAENPLFVMSVAVVGSAVLGGGGYLVLRGSARHGTLRSPASKGTGGKIAEASRKRDGDDH